MTEKSGFRGYIYSRRILGERIPQAVQNLVIRDYCARNEFTYLLSATEYAMPECFMILDGVCKELNKLEGLVAYSLFMLPDSSEKRWEIYNDFIGSNSALCGAIEGTIIRSADDAERFEQLWAVRKIAEKSSTVEILAALNVPISQI